MHASNLPSAFLRKKFGFQSLPDYKPEIWKQVKSEGKKNIIDIPNGLISGSDISEDAVKLSADNCWIIDKKKHIRLAQKNIFDIKNLENKVIICNPPYGIRMGRTKDLGLFYKEFGDFLKQRCKGSAAYIYFGDRKYIKNIGLRTSWKKALTSGGLDGRLVKIELY
jgi:putative N6-adenine-specific DNA methylase